MKYLPRKLYKCWEMFKILRNGGIEHIRGLENYMWKRCQFSLKWPLDSLSISGQLRSSFPEADKLIPKSTLNCEWLSPSGKPEVSDHRLTLFGPLWQNPTHQGAQTADLYFSRSWRRGVPAPGAGGSGSWWGPSSRLVDSGLLTVCSHAEKDCHLLGGLNSHPGGPTPRISFKPYHLPSCCVVGLQHMDLGGTHIQSLTLPKVPYGAIVSNTACC